MWLVLCPTHDLSAIWAYERLKERGLSPLEIVAAETLGCSLRWEHRLGAEGVRVTIDLADGRTIEGDRVRGVLNRLQAAPLDALAVAEPGDVDYASQELYAFFLSWLHALPGVVLNPPTPQGLCGRWRHVSEWLVLAARAGLPTPDYRWSPAETTNENGFGPTRLAPPGARTTTVFVVDQQVVGNTVPEAHLSAARRLARSTGSPLLGIDFSQTPSGDWLFAGASSIPDLTAGGEALIDALYETLETEETA